MITGILMSFWEARGVSRLRLGDRGIFSTGGRLCRMSRVLEWNKARVELSEHAVSIEKRLSMVLAMHYGRDQVAVLSLLRSVF